MSRFVNVKEVIQRTSLSRTTIWRMVKKGEFPSQIKIGMIRVAWLDMDIENWMNDRKERTTQAKHN